MSYNNHGYKSKTFLSAQSNNVDLNKVINEQTQLTKLQKLQLLACLQKHEKLFDGTLGKFQKYQIKLKLRENAQPCASRIYPVF